MGAQENKKDIFWLHFAVTVFFMFIFGHVIPPVAPITKLGMQCLGIFIGIVYAWSTTSLLWPSFLAIVAVVLTGAYTMNTWLPVSFANPTVVFLIFIFVFTKVIDDAGVVKFLAAWIMSRKIVRGRPWLFSFFLLLGAFIGGIFVNDFAAALIFWGILYAVCQQFGYKPYEKYSSMMILGIVFAASTLGGTVLPFRLTGLVMISTMSAVAPDIPIGSGAYIAYVLPMGLLLLVVYLMIMKYVFRIDLSAMEKISNEFVEQNDLVLDKRQKALAVLLLVTTILLVSIDLLPKTWAIGMLMKALGTIGVMLLVMVFMLIVKIDGEPLMNYKTAARGIQWDMVYLFAFVLPFSSLLTADAIGIKSFIIQYLSPIFIGKSPLVFIIVVSLVGTVLSNVANNAVLAVIFINLAVPICASMGISPLPFVFLQSFTIQLAYMTPAASAPAALVLANSAWIKPTMMYKYIAIILVIMFVVIIAVGLPYACLLFGL